MPTKIDFMHVVAEMVASVHSFEAEIGDQVSAGDTLLILESMKMEIRVLLDFFPWEEAAMAPYWRDIHILIWDPLGGVL